VASTDGRAILSGAVASSFTQERVLRWFSLLRRHAWWLIVPAVILGLGATIDAQRKDVGAFRARTVLFAQSQLPGSSAQQQNQTEDFGPFLRAQAQLAKSSGVLGKAAAALGSGTQDLQDFISTSVDGSSNTLTISARSSDSKSAMVKANAVAETLSATGLGELAARLKVRSADLQGQIDRLDATVQDLNKKLQVARTELSDTTTLEARRSTATSQYAALVSSQQELLNQIALQRAPLAILEPATKAMRTSGPSLPLRGGLGALAGLLLGAFAVWLRQLLDDTVRNVEQVEEIVDAPLLAELPTEKLRRGSSLPTLDHPTGGLSESFRGLRTALKFIDQGERLRSLAVVSSEPRDGKTFTAANLAVSFAQAGSKTCVVSADLRNPALDAVFGVGGNPGLADLLAENIHGDEFPKVELFRFVCTTEIDGLSVLPAGTLPANPSELLASPRATQVMDELHQNFDVVIVDSPPLLVADPEIIGDLVDGLILVVSVDGTRVRRLRRATGRLTGSPLRLAGVVVNRTNPRKGYYGPYGAAYSTYSKGGGGRKPASAAKPGKPGKPGNATPSEPVSSGKRG
jgi:polysaccharide biosynthesis transport protein